MTGPGRAMRYLKVKNLDRYQHYSDRRPPWIKLYQGILEDVGFTCLQDASKAHAILLFLLASRYQNKIPADPVWLGRALHATEPVDVEALVGSGLFLVLGEDSDEDVRKQSASNVLATRKQSAKEMQRPLEERREEREESSSSSRNSSQEHPNIVEPPEKRGSTGVVKRNGHPATVAQAKARGIEILREVATETGKRIEGERRREGMVDFIFAYWAARTAHTNALLDTKRATRLRRRLEENNDDVNEMCFVVDGLFKDRHLMGENDRNRRYDGIETIFRDREIVERLAELGGYEHGKVHRFVQKYTTGETH
jgi:hypothetical protein